jgi:hypothetical protein
MATQHALPKSGLETGDRRFCAEWRRPDRVEEMQAPRCHDQFSVLR